MARMLAYLALQLAIIGLCLLARQVSPPLPPAALKLQGVELQDDTGQFHPVTLPDFRPVPVEPLGVAVYRVTFERTPSQDLTPWAIFVPRFTTSLELSVNGVVIHDTRRNVLNRRPERNISAMATIPAKLLQDGKNELTLRLLIWGPLSGYLDSVYAGPEAQLAPVHERRTLLFETLPLLMIAGQATLGGILGMIWLSRRNDHSYGLLALAMLIGFAQYLVSMPAPPQTLGLVGAAVVAQAPLILHFIVRFIGRQPSPWLLLTFLPPIAIAMAGFLGRHDFLRSIFLPLGPPAIGVCIILVCLLLGRAALQGNRNALILGMAFSVMLGCALSDILTFTRIIPGERLFIGWLGYWGVLMVIGSWLTWRFVQALNDADSFADRLVRQVTQAEEKLRANFAREEERARAVALSLERTRLMRDLHDGLGGQLVSIVALSERSGDTTNSIGDAARAALRDLRLVIDAMEEIDGDLMLALGSWRERISGQLRAHRMNLGWSVRTPGGLPVYPGLRPRHVIQLIRLLDEAVTNAIKHSSATTVTITIETLADESGVSRGHIRVDDNGHGFSPETEPLTTSGQGRGLLNMKKRAALCGVALSISSQSTGTSVALTLPDDFPEAFQAS
ncbi:ATP-binding protein [Rhizobium sp. FY34]|uniref:sensor histidine kinase n=1 Tax=Rhizobium sp. FY34 TaxID=2562309 RepID=UPI0014853A68|nr:ATP-binding protein [Rhizobium sp. FY34]